MKKAAVISHACWLIILVAGKSKIILNWFFYVLLTTKPFCFGGLIGMQAILYVYNTGNMSPPNADACWGVNDIHCACVLYT